MSSYERALPVEQWQEILQLVPPSDLRNLVLSSKYMNSVASWPDLWRGMRVNMVKVRQEGIADLFTVHRFKKITKMDFSQVDFTSQRLERLLNDILRSPLTEINLYGIKLRLAPAELLARVVFSMYALNAGFTHLPVEHCVKVLEAGAISRTLTNLNLMDVNLSEVPAELLARAVYRLEAVNLTYTRLTPNQCVAVLEASESSTTLVDLNLKDNNLRVVPAELLARAVTRLQTANLGVTYLTTDQCVAVLQACLSSRTLANLDFLYINLSGVPAYLLAHAVSRLQTANLHFTHLTTEQSVAVLEAGSHANNLNKLELMDVNLSEVPADLLARAVSRLEEANFGYTSLTHEQSVKVLEAVTHSTTLINLNLTFIKLSMVPPDLLANIISKLQILNLSFTQLGPDLCNTVLESIINSKTIVNMDLRRVTLTAAPADLLARAVSCLHTVNLDYTEMTTSQCVTTLEAIILSKTLANVSLLGVDLSGVPADLLGRAVSGLRDANLISCSLKLYQILVVVAASVNSRTLVTANLGYNGISDRLACRLLSFLPARITL